MYEHGDTYDCEEQVGEDGCGERAEHRVGDSWEQYPAYYHERAKYDSITCFHEECCGDEADWYYHPALSEEVYVGAEGGVPWLVDEVGAVDDENWE